MKAGYPKYNGKEVVSPQYLVFCTTKACLSQNIRDREKLSGLEYISEFCVGKNCTDIGYYGNQQNVKLNS